MRLKNLLFPGLIVLILVSGCARAPHKTPKSHLMPAPVPASQAGGFYHTVERGQTLYRLSKNYNVDLKELMQANHLTGTNLEVGQKLLIPHQQAPYHPPVSGRMTMEEIRRFLGPVKTPSRWKTITVHHSGTTRGSGKLFHRDHLRRGMGGLFYHFVIGNGSSTPDGFVEVGWRWKKQVPSKRNRPYDIQICLVGDFNKQRVTTEQFNSLVCLVKALEADYHVPSGGLRKHEDIKGKATECPGRHFPFQRLQAETD